MNKIALVTGSAKGIGRAIVEKLASDGYDVVINYLSSSELAFKLKNEIIDKYAVKCLAFKCDVSKVDEVDFMFDNVEKELGNVSVLVNNAAVDYANLFNLKTSEEFLRLLDINVVGYFNTFKRAYKKMLEQEYGRVVNISSTNGINTYYPMSIDYDASKAAVISLTHNMAMQGAPFIHVNCVAPGFIGTESELDGYDEEFLKEECDKILLKRYGKPEEVANLVSFLVSDKADYINNSIIRIDGGQTSSN